MVQIIPAREDNQSFLARLSNAVGYGLEEGSNLYNQSQKNRMLKEHLGYDVSHLTPEMQAEAFRNELLGRREREKYSLQQQEEGRQKEKLVSLLTSRGIDPKDAELYAELTTGGQTEFAKDILEARKRGMDAFGERQTKSFDKLGGVDSEVNRIIETQDQGLTPKEKVDREKQRYDSGLKIYEDNRSKLISSKKDRQRLDILESLNKSKKLPKNFGRINVDLEGNLRFPFATTPEAERYVKTLNEFSEGAKDSYGARVTNFDLQQYFRRFPNLLNSEEGRNQILQQMKIVNDINATYYKNLKEVFDKAGGARHIDADVAERLADEKSFSQVDKLMQKFQDIGEFNSKPSAKEFKGKKIRDTDTGEIFISDGFDWIPQDLFNQIGE